MRRGLGQTRSQLVGKDFRLFSCNIYIKKNCIGYKDLIKLKMF